MHLVNLFLIGTFFQILTALSVDNSFLGFALKSLQNETTLQRTSMAFLHGKLSELKVSEPNQYRIYENVLSFLRIILRFVVMLLVEG